MAEKELKQIFPIRSIFEKFSTTRDVSLVYGDPINLENKTVLPVAKVRYNVGGGSGYDGGNPEENKHQSGGEGSGGHFLIKPLGVYDITAKKTVYKPVVPLDLIFLLPLAVTTLALLVVSKKDKK